MAYLRTLDQMCTVPWGKSYLWDCKLPQAPSPFNEWFPAQTVDESLFDIVDKTINIGSGTFSLPSGYGECDIKLNMLDDNNCTLEKFFTEWKNKMFPSRTSVATITEVVKEIYIAKLNNQREITHEVGFWVRPSGQFFFQGNTDSAVRVYNVTLKICGLVGKP